MQSGVLLCVHFYFSIILLLYSIPSVIENSTWCMYDLQRVEECIVPYSIVLKLVSVWPSWEFTN